MSNIARNKVWFSLLGILSIVLVVLLAQTALGKNEQSSKPKKTEQKQTEAPAGLQMNAYPKVNALMNKYYDASTHGNTETLKEIIKPFTESDEAAATRKSGFIEEYTNITCYTELGVDPDTYIVFVNYDLKFPNVDTPAPGLETWFVCTDEQGELYINNDQSQLSQELLNQLQELMERDDVKSLSQQVELKFAQALEKDPNLKALCEQMGADVNAASGTEAPSQSPSADATQAPPATAVPIGDVKNEWMTIMDVELYAEPKEGQAVTAIPAGTTLWVDQHVEGGFSFVEKDGTTGYVKTAGIADYELVDQEITATVNYYGSCSDGAQVMGTITSDTPYYCTLKFTNGWGQILVDGQKVYVKNIDSLLGTGGNAAQPSVGENGTAPAASASPAPSQSPAPETDADENDTVDANENDQ